MRQAEWLANRIALGIVAAAFIVGLAMLLAVYHPPAWEQWAGAFFAVGFVIAAVLGAYLAWSILRSLASAVPARPWVCRAVPITVYRILCAAGEATRRRDHRERSASLKPELLATRPKQLWSV